MMECRCLSYVHVYFSPLLSIIKQAKKISIHHTYTEHTSMRCGWLDTESLIHPRCSTSVVQLRIFARNGYVATWPLASASASLPCLLPVFCCGGVVHRYHVSNIIIIQVRLLRVRV